MCALLKQEEIENKNTLLGKYKFINEEKDILWG